MSTAEIIDDLGNRVDRTNQKLIKTTKTVRKVQMKASDTGKIREAYRHLCPARTKPMSGLASWVCADLKRIVLLDRVHFVLVCSTLPWSCGGALCCNVCLSV